VGPADVPTLEESRRAFRATLASADADAVIDAFTGRIGVVLSGGGALGAYEAGALLAFQDAHLPSHIVTATSVGSVNAASFAAESETLVGNAERLVGYWLELTPGHLGIEWTRYGWMAAGLIATSAGLGNLAYYLLTLAGIEIHLRYPAAAWLSLALAGASVLLFYPQLPYVWHLILARLRHRPLEAERRRLGQSVAANLLVGSFLVAGSAALHLDSTFSTVLRRHPIVIAALLAALAVLRLVHRRFTGGLGRLWERAIRFVLHPGLFNNFQRARFLRGRIPLDRLRHSPMRVLFTATDLLSGSVRHFSNTPPDRLAADPGADRAFILGEVSAPDDPLPAIVASSALPITFEPMEMEGRLLADGAVMGSQPISPAIRMGADVLFLVLLDPQESRPGAARSFVDVGTRALDILMHQNLRSDLRELTAVNRMCERASRELHVPPEAVTIELAERHLRYLRPFVIRPAHAIGLTVHDFGGSATPYAIASGYDDAAAQIGAFLDYARTARFDHARRTLRLMPADAIALRAAL
jgi:predicted acylesterase/phospholipase RssA